MVDRGCGTKGQNLRYEVVFSSLRVWDQKYTTPQRCLTSKSRVRPTSLLALLKLRVWCSFPTNCWPVDKTTSTEPSCFTDSRKDLASTAIPSTPSKFSLKSAANAALTKLMDMSSIGRILSAWDSPNLGEATKSGPHLSFTSVSVNGPCSHPLLTSSMVTFQTASVISLLLSPPWPPRPKSILLLHLDDFMSCCADMAGSLRSSSNIRLRPECPVKDAPPSSSWPQHPSWMPASSHISWKRRICLSRTTISLCSGRAACSSFSLLSSCCFLCS